MLIFLCPNALSLNSTVSCNFTHFLATLRQLFHMLSLSFACIHFFLNLILPSLAPPPLLTPFLSFLHSCTLSCTAMPFLTTSISPSHVLAPVSSQAYPLSLPAHFCTQPTSLPLPLLPLTLSSLPFFLSSHTFTLIISPLFPIPLSFFLSVSTIFSCILFALSLSLFLQPHLSHPLSLSLMCALTPHHTRSCPLHTCTLSCALMPILSCVCFFLGEFSLILS